MFLRCLIVDTVYRFVIIRKGHPGRDRMVLVQSVSTTTNVVSLNTAKPHDGVMVSMLTSNEVDRGFEPQSDQAKDYKIGICCFSAKHAALRRMSKDWLARIQDNVSEWGYTSIQGLLFQ